MAESPLGCEVKVKLEVRSLLLLFRLLLNHFAQRETRENKIQDLTLSPPC
jgi:hypothetical protein